MTAPEHSDLLKKIQELGEIIQRGLAIQEQMAQQLQTVEQSSREHAFTLTFSNTQTTTTSRYNSSNLVLKPKDLVIGFNLFRRW